MSRHIAMIPAYLWDKYKLKIAAGETVTLSDDGTMYTVEFDLPADKCVPYETIKALVVYYEVDDEVVIDEEIERLIPYRYVFKIRRVHYANILRNLQYRLQSSKTFTSFSVGDEYVTLQLKSPEYPREDDLVRSIPCMKVLHVAAFVFDRYDNKVIKNRWGDSKYKDIFNDI